jgi:hypothetical protein
VGRIESGRGANFGYEMLATVQIARERILYGLLGNIPRERYLNHFDTGNRTLLEV